MFCCFFFCYELFYVEFACSPRTRVGFLRVHRLPPTFKNMQVWLIGYFKLGLGEGLSMPY